MGALLSDIAGWFARVAEEVARVSLWALLAAVVLQTLQTALNAVAWRNILHAAYPRGGVSLPPVFGAFSGSVGLNHVLPAQAGTIAMLGLFRGMIAGATVPGVLGAQLVQTLFFGAVGIAFYALLFVTIPGAGGVHFDALLDHPVLAAAVAGAVVAAAVVGLRLLRPRMRRALADAREGAAILRTPRRFVTGVLAPQVGSLVVRMGLMAVLMSAYGIPATPRNVALAIAATSVSTLVALTPGGIGTQQALMVVALSGAASSSTIAAYSFGQQAILTAWNVGLGLLALSLTIGWEATRGLIHERWREARARRRGRRGPGPLRERLRRGGERPVPPPEDAPPSEPRADA